MSFEYRSPGLRDPDSRRVFMISFGLLLLFVAILSPTMVNNASGQDTQEEKTEQNNTKLVRQYMSAVNTGNVSNVSQFISPQYFTNPGLPVDPAKAKLRGPEAFIDEVKNVRGGFPDYHREVQAIVAQGNTVVAISNVTGTHLSKFFTIPATGNKASWELIQIFRIGEGGKIAEHRAIRDNLGFLAQLGVIGPTSVSSEYRPFLKALMDDVGVTNSSR